MRPEQKLASLLETTDDLLAAAGRVDGKFGHDQGEPSDWQEWIDLRRAMMRVQHARKRFGHAKEKGQQHIATGPRSRQKPVRA